MWLTPQKQDSRHLNVNDLKKELKGKAIHKYIKRQMPNYANTQLYELIEHDTQGNPIVYRGHTTQPLHKRLAGHRKDFKYCKEGKGKYCSSFEVLKHGPARIELVRVVSCFDKREANREEGKFIRELPTCVNICKNYANKGEHYQANKETKLAKSKEYYEENKDNIKAKAKEYQQANKETIKAKDKEYYQANKDTIKEKAKEYYQANKETRKARVKTYHQANKDTIKTRKGEKVTCECGVVVNRSSMSLHRKTWKHIHDFIHM
jgi:hypothetical protein